MQTVVVAILTLGVLCCTVKLSLLPPWARLLWGTLAALATGLAAPLAAAQSKTQLADFLANPAAMADAAVLITLEVALTVAYCIAAPTTPKPRWLARVGRTLLAAFPGAVVFAALFALLTSLMFTLTGTPFALTAWGMAALVWVLLPTLAWAARTLLPERNLRLELLFLSSLLMGALAIVATVNGRTAVESTAAVDWPQLLTVVALTAAGIATGLALHRRRKQKHIHHS